MGTKVYCASEVSITFAGVPIEGTGEDEFCRVEYREDAFSIKVGANGEVVRSQTNNESGTVTLTLLQTADANNLLSALFNADRLSKNGAGIAPLLIRDRQGLSLWTSDDAWIRKLPDAPFGVAAGERVWTLDCGHLKGFVGGN